MSESGKIIGIDLGTTNSVLSVIREGKAELLPIQGKELLPSVVGLSEQGEVLVGTPARNQWVAAPDRTIRSIKRKMGSKETVTMAGDTYTPQEISAFILREIKMAAEDALGESVERAVITVPAYFNEVQRQATLEAGEIAGLVVERIINEPTAASLAHGYGLDDDEYMRILVYDLGGGTFDVSIIELNYGVIDVMATAGDNLLGGDDFDEELAALLADEFQEEHEQDLRQDHQAWARLLRAAEEAKIELSSQAETPINLEYIGQDDSNRPLHIQREVLRFEFEDLIEEMLDRTRDCIDNALADAKLEASDIDRVLLVGGSTRIPAVWRLVSEHLGRDPHTEIDPDAAVALGAAVQAGIIAGEDIDAILVDVTPLSLGVEAATITMMGQVQADKFVPLIRRNTTIPVQHSEMFSTLHPDQDAVHVRVFQGESSVASQNTLLGEFHFEDLETRPNELTEVNVHFQLDINGILNITVTDKNSGRHITEQMKATRQRMSPEEIAESQAKLAATPQEITSDAVELAPDIAVLLERARKVIEDPELEPDQVEDVQTAMQNLLEAVSDGEDELIEDYSDELIDILIDLEEE